MNTFVEVYRTDIKTTSAPIPPVDRLSHLFLTTLTTNVRLSQQQVTSVVSRVTVNGVLLFEVLFRTERYQHAG
jgi:hypothetical protein